jgi:hypothetical protein
MPNIITKRVRVSRRLFLKGLTAAQSAVVLGLPPLVSMFNSTGTAYAAETHAGKKPQPIEKRFVLWFNGNGIPERYWIPDLTGPDYDLTPCLIPLARLRNHVHVISGLDNSAIVNTAFDGHATAMSALMTCTRFSGRGPGGPSLDQIVARKFNSDTRFRSLQIGVSQESFGAAMQNNMSWSGPDRALPPEDIPHRLFDRVFGGKDEGWIKRKRSILDSVREESNLLRAGLPKEDSVRLDEHLSSVRDLERAIATLPPNYRQVVKPDEDFDMKDWPRIAKIQSDLLAYALATRQTRVASYMLTKCQGLARFPWLGHTAARHHDYTHHDGKAPGADGVEGQKIMRDICRWHVEEFAYLVGKLKSIPEGDGALLDNTLLISVHEHAEANLHKASGMTALLAGSKDRQILGRHTRVMGTVGDLYLTLTNGVLDTRLSSLPTATKQLPGILI